MVKGGLGPAERSVGDRVHTLDNGHLLSWKQRGLNLTTHRGRRQRLDRGVRTRGTR